MSNRSNFILFLLLITLLQSQHAVLGFSSSTTSLTSQRRIPSSSAIFVTTKTKETNGLLDQIKAPFGSSIYNVSLSSTTIPMEESPSSSVKAELVTPTNDKDSSSFDTEGLVWRGVVLVLCALWASNFSAAKLILAEPGVDSSLYAVARFSLAALALAPAGWKLRDTVSPETFTKSFQCGAWVAFGYLGQTLGLLTTTASKSCVICSLHCVFVAAIAEMWRVRNFEGETEYDIQRLIPAFIAVAGVAVIELQGAGGAPTIGDALSLAQPIGFGMGYLTLEQIMEDSPEAALPVSAIKLSVVAASSFVMFEILPLLQQYNTPSSASSSSDAAGLVQQVVQIPDFTPILQSPLAIGGILYTGLITTALALWVESQAFRRVPATDASLILTTEPLMAAGIGAITLGETFGMSDYIGAAMIVGACVIATMLDQPAVGPVDCNPETDDECQLERRRPFFGVF